MLFRSIEIKIQGNIDTQIALITASAQTAQSAFEWSAKVDIADAEASAEVLKSAFSGVATSVEALSGSTADMFGSLLDNYEKLSSFEQGQFTRLAEDQQEAQNKALASQTKLNDALAANLVAKTEAIASGESVITIDSSGLEPALEMVMWNIIEKVQIRANEASADFLLGI